MSDAFADSCVETIEHCLNTPPEEHRMECEEEWWLCEVGERPAMYFGMTMLEPYMAFVSAILAWNWAIGGES